MKPYFITIDCGTTNTRTTLWNREQEAVAEQKREAGVRNTAMDGNNHVLKTAVRECLEGLLRDAAIGYGDVQCVIASGMITSNVGLVEIPHLVAPVTPDELAGAIRGVALEEVCPLPIHFIPGIKNADGVGELSQLEKMDIMRGEEVESCALIAGCHTGKPMLLVLPGSHTKFVAVDANRAITGCLTTISGELLASITNHTIIADAVGRSFVDEETYDRDMVVLGYDTAKQTGLGRTCFSARILSQFVTKDVGRVASFVLGAALQNDILAIQNSAAVRADRDTTVVVSGKNPLRRAFLDLMSHEDAFGAVREFAPPEGISLSAVGSIELAKKANLL